MASIQEFADAIAAIESAGSGGYSAIGPTTRYGTALGRYQILDSNLPSWLAQSGLPPMSGSEFLANPQAQDTVFANIFGGYVQRFGPEGAAAAWFAGPAGASNPAATDTLGTSVSAYVAKFRAAMGSLSGITPAAIGAGRQPSTEQPDPGMPWAQSPNAAPGASGALGSVLAYISGAVTRVSVILLGLVIVAVGLALLGRTRPIEAYDTVRRWGSYRAQRKTAAALEAGNVPRKPAPARPRAPRRSKEAVTMDRIESHAGKPLPASVRARGMALLKGARKRGRKPPGSRRGPSTKGD